MEKFKKRKLEEFKKFIHEQRERDPMICAMDIEDIKETILDTINDTLNEVEEMIEEQFKFCEEPMVLLRIKQGIKELKNG